MSHSMVSHMISSLFGYVSRESGQMIRTHVHEDGIAGGAPRIRPAGLLGLLACGAVTSHESTRFAASHESKRFYS